MTENVIFYNHYGNGDLFLSREFVKEIMGIIPAKNYYYAHAKHPRMFADIPELIKTDISGEMRMRSRCYRANNDIFINTWLGVDSTYVTEANSCSVLNSYKMFNHILRELGYQELTQALINYLPSLDYSKFNIGPINEFVSSNKNIVLVCNCQAQSGQASNFDMTNVVQALCENHRDKIFAVSDHIAVTAPNYITTAEIIQSPDGFDLNEISYLSTYSNRIIGRSSGFYNFAATRENCMNPDKTFIAFTYKRESAHLVWQEPTIAAKIVWSSSTKFKEVYEVIEKELSNV